MSGEETTPQPETPSQKPTEPNKDAGNKQTTTTTTPEEQRGQAPQQPAELSRDLRMELGRDKDGKAIEMTLGEMADAAIAARSAPQLSDEDKENLAHIQLLQKVMAGDETAIAELRTKSGVEGQESKGQVPAEIVAAMQQRIDALEKRHAETSAVTGQIQSLRQTQMLKAVIEQQAKNVPFLAHDPEGPQLVQARLNEFRALAKQNGIELDNHPRAADILAQAMRDADTYLKKRHEVFHNWTPGESPKPEDKHTETQPVNDQPRVPSNVIPGGYRALHGEVQTDTKQSPGADQEQVPRDIPAPTPGGSHIGAGEGTRQRGPYDLDGLTERLRARKQAMATQPE